MADRYRGFAELAANTTRGIDYDVVVRTRARDRAVVVAAPHGGGIEPGSDELAARIAGAEHALYAFQGLRAHDNDALHLTSARFDEPAALALVTAAEAAVTVHGCRGRRERVYVGGLNDELGARVCEALSHAGFPVADPPAGLQGRKPANLTNRPRRAGVQLELSWPLRRRLLGELAGDADDGHAADGGHRGGHGWPAGDVETFVGVVRAAVAAWRDQPASPVSGSSCSATELMQ